MNEVETLPDLLLDDRVAGLSFDHIAKKHGMAPEDVRVMVREELSKTAEEDEWEMRALTLLRLEKVVSHLWRDVEKGSFKHAEAMFKGLDQIANLLALNKQVMEKQQAAISDEQAALIYHILTENNNRIKAYIDKTLKPNKTQRAALEEWASVAAEVSTGAIEATLVEEDDEE